MAIFYTVVSIPNADSADIFSAAQRIGTVLVDTDCILQPATSSPI